MVCSAADNFPNLVILVGVDVPGEAEVRYLERELLPQEAVPGGQVPVGEVSLGEVLHAAGDLEAHPPEVGLEGGKMRYFCGLAMVL